MHRQTYNAGSISLETCAASSRPCRKSGTCRKVEARIDSGAVMPFSVDAFLDVFAAYNTALWPFALLLWVILFDMIRVCWRATRGASVLPSAETPYVLTQMGN